jgi:hypothetical protein
MGPEVDGIQRLCRIAVPGLSVKRDFTAARRRLLAAFPAIQEVIATTAPGTLLVLSCGPEDVDGWLDTLEVLTIREVHRSRGLLRRRGRGSTKDDSAA